MKIEELLHPKEDQLKPIVFVLSALAWLGCVCSIVGPIYGVFLLPFVLMAQAYFLGAMRASGIRIDARQLPHLHARVMNLSHKLGLPEVPEVYVVQSGGVLNAFAAKLFGRKYVMLYSNLIDQCGTEQELDFVIAHELMHHAAGHLKWQTFTLPVRLIPLLGAAWSRACEYTCDRAALYAVDALEPSQRALAILAGGSQVGKAIDLRVFAEQQSNSAEFWPAVYELSSSHPLLSKRVAMLGRFEEERKQMPVTYAEAPGRPAFAYLFGMFTGQQALVMLSVVYLIGILAAIAIPNFKKFQERARQQQEAAQPYVPGAFEPSESSESPEEPAYELTEEEAQ